jgi:hypothetical protein
MARALRAEFMKLRRSRMPLWTSLVVAAVAALSLVLFPVLTDAKIHTKIAAGGGSFAKAVAEGLYDPTYAGWLRVGLQGMTGSWGIMAFGLATAYMFARESREGTAAIAFTGPVRREHLVLSKLLVLAVWVFGLGTLSVLLQTGACALLGATGFSVGVVSQSLGEMVGVVVLLFASLPLVGWVAMTGKGYMRPMLVSLVMWFSCNGLMMSPASKWIPWTMPIYLVGASWEPVPPSALAPASWLVAAAVFLVGLAACLHRADSADVIG